MAAVTVLATVLLAACSSGGGESSPRTQGSTTAPSTVLITQAHDQPVAVPFTADQGALVVEPGPAPDGLSSDDAVVIFRTVLDRMTNSYPPDTPLPDHQVLQGRVTLAPQLGTNTPPGAPAWVITYPGFIGSCPAAIGTIATDPPWSSGLYAIIVVDSKPGHAIAYYGAGTAVCPPGRTQPQATVGPDATN